ncbi:hypothetical protein NDU88_003197 [Pleurodeles waltl]|uniref:Uncharacterized protein n=1 Tax=Pleurodeles waltl TaxID=8319 RepID=A0AAV7W4M9_PLEWA|nr:hypothetical protein NDU88_003197 [Pleurodeles waltl]
MTLNKLFTSPAEYTLQRLQGLHYEQGEKAGRLLEAQLCQKAATLAIPAIKAQTGETLTHPQEIVCEFVTSYLCLYAPESQTSPAQIEAFLNNVTLPSLSDEGRELLGGDITSQEILQVVSSLPYHKSSGEDGIPAELYKWTEEETLDVLHGALEEACQTNSLGAISNAAIIAVIPKPGWDPLLCGSY